MAGNNEEIDEATRQFLLDELEFNLERQADLEFDEEHDNIWLFNDEGMVLVDEGFVDDEEFDDGLFDEDMVEVHYGEHPVLPGHDPRGPPYMVL